MLENNGLVRAFRGEIYQANLGMNSFGIEVKPFVIVIQNDTGNHYAENVIVVPLYEATNYNKDKFKNYPMIKLFNKNYFVNYKDINTIDRIRLIPTPKPYGKLTEEEDNELNKKLAEFLITEKEFKRGQVRWLKVDDGKLEEYELHGERGAVILRHNKTTNEYIVALTTKSKKRGIDTHVHLETEATIFLEHIRTVPANELGLSAKYVLNKKEMKEMEKCLRISLAI